MSWKELEKERKQADAPIAKQPKGSSDEARHDSLTT